MNAIHLTGRLTRDPDLRQLPSGASVCKMRLAVDRMGRSNSTGYIDVTSFGRPAEAHIAVNGGAGDDLLSGRGTARPGLLGSVSTTLPLTLFGGRGADILEGGRGIDELSGGGGSDILNSLDGEVDHLTGGEGFDLANTDSIDRADDVIESRTNAR